MGTNFAEPNQKERGRQGAERTMLLALAAAPMIEGLFTGFETVPPKGGEGPLNLGEAPGAGSGGAQTGGAGAQAGTGKTNNFSNMKGLDDFKSRIPSNANELPWRNMEGGAAEGVKYQWTDAEGNVWNVRAHSIDPNAPFGSNASKGWIYRVEVRWGGTEKIYFMDSSGNFHPQNIMNPNSPMYDAAIANDTHIMLDGR